MSKTIISQPIAPQPVCPYKGGDIKIEKRKGVWYWVVEKEVVDEDVLQEDG